MKIQTSILIATLSVLLTRMDTQATTSQQQPKEQCNTRMEWWRAAKFGMFLHWGPVSQAGTELSWSRKGSKPLDITGDAAGFVEDPVYDNLYKTFNPTAYNAHEWVNIAKAAGMKYIVLTCKHHDGFSLFHTKATDYSIASTPFQRNIVKELADACHEAGMRFGVYYSPRDWHHPEYGIGDNRKYVDYMDTQVRELLTNYGQVDIIWWDSYGKGDLVDFWHIGETHDMVRALQPGIVMNNRMATLGAYNQQPAAYRGDFDTPEQTVGRMQTDRPWESCITLVGHQWSYKPNGEMMKPAEVLQTLITCITGDGNLLLNIGPMPTGQIEPRQEEVLKTVGNWLAQYGESVYDTRGGPLHNGNWGGTTYRDTTIYLHILHWPGETIHLRPIDEKIVSARALTGGTAQMEQNEKEIAITLSPKDRDPIDTVIELKLDRPASKIYENERLASIFDDPGYGTLISDTSAPKSTSPDGNPPSIIIDLGTIQNVKGVRITHRREDPRARDLELYLSEDKATWNKIWQGQQIEGVWEVPVTQMVAGAQVAGVRGQYLKINFPGASVQPMFLNRVEVFGDIK